jgi:hypothetical protein
MSCWIELIVGTRLYASASIEDRIPLNRPISISTMPLSASGAVFTHIPQHSSQRCVFIENTSSIASNVVPPTATNPLIPKSMKHQKTANYSHHTTQRKDTPSNPKLIPLLLSIVKLLSTTNTSNLLEGNG